MRYKRFGLLGGTFNPVHRGHIDLGTRVRDAFRLHLHAIQIAFIRGNEPLRLHPTEERVGPHGLRVRGAEHLLEDLKGVEAAGAAAVTIHPRLQTKYFKGYANWEMIARVKQAVSIPVIGNGDIQTAADARAMYDETGCDLVMIGRGAMGNPWIFNRIEAAFAQESPMNVDATERWRVIQQHLSLVSNEKGDARAVREMRKHLAWYIKGMPKSATLRARLMQVKTMADVLTALTEFFSPLVES